MTTICVITLEVRLHRLIKLEKKVLTASSMVEIEGSSAKSMWFHFNKLLGNNNERV
jgi:hypothetical protein